MLAAGMPDEDRFKPYYLGLIVTLIGDSAGLHLDHVQALGLAVCEVIGIVVWSSGGGDVVSRMPTCVRCEPGSALRYSTGRCAPGWSYSMWRRSRR